MQVRASGSLKSDGVGPRLLPNLAFCHRRLGKRRRQIVAILFDRYLGG